MRVDTKYAVRNTRYEILKRMGEKIKNITVMICAVAFIVGVGFIPESANAENLYEWFSGEGEEFPEGFSEEDLYGQIFTPQDSHQITKVKLVLCRQGNPGTALVGIKATDENGKPTGDNLVSGYFDGNAIVKSWEENEWVEVGLSPNSRQEYFNTGDEDYQNIYYAEWFGQTFTPSSTHLITNAKLLLYKTGNPGPVTISIKAVDEDGLPAGPDLAIGMLSGNSLTTDSAGEWREVSLTPYTLNASTQYAIVLRAPYPDEEEDRLHWLSLSTGGYADGAMVGSDDWGSSWGISDYDDFMFEEWGEDTVSDNPVLLADTKYAIVMQAPEGDWQNRICWWMNGTGETYPYSRGYDVCIDPGSGEWQLGESSWLFEEWGNEAGGENGNGGGEPIPEPTSILLLGFGVLGLTLFRKKVVN